MPDALLSQPSQLNQSWNGHQSNNGYIPQWLGYHFNTMSMLQTCTNVLLFIEASMQLKTLHYKLTCEVGQTSSASCSNTLN